MGTVATKQAQAYIARMIAKQAPNIYIGLGKSTAWKDEDKVPDSNPDATALTEPIVYTKAQNVSLCQPVSDDNNTGSSIIFGGSKYKVVSVLEELNPAANCVYATANFSYEDLKSEIQFRQVGLYIGLRPKSGVTSTIITPLQIDDLGTLLSIQNMKLANITKTSSVKVGAMYSILPIFS